MQQQARILLVTILATILWTLTATAPAAAEVMDKEPALRTVWVSAALWAVLGFATGRLHPLLGVVVLFLPFTSPAVGALDAVRDSAVGPAIRREAGPSYGTQVYLANALTLLCYVGGGLLWAQAHRRVRAARSSPP